MKNLPQNLNRELQGLRNVRPDLDWKAQTRTNLINTLNIEESTGWKNVFVFRRVFSSFFNDAFSRFSWAPVTALFLMLVLVIPGVATVNAARTSLPGDALYSVKQGMEQVQISLTFSDKKKAEIQVGFVENRLHELQRLTHEQTGSSERQAKIQIALQELKKDTVSATASLQIVKEEGNGEAVALAKSIEESTAAYKEDLEMAIASLDDATMEETRDDIDLALSTVQIVALGALDVLVDNHEEGSGTVEEEDLKERVYTQLNAVKAQINGLLVKLSAFEAVQTGLADKTSEEEESSEPAEGDEVVEELGTEIETIREELNQLLNRDLAFVDELLELGDLTQALTVLSRAKESVDVLAEQIRSLDFSPEPVVEESSEESETVEGEEVVVEEVDADEEDSSDPVE